MLESSAPVDGQSKKNNSMPFLADVDIPDLQRVRQQYHEQMPVARTPATLGVRPVMPAPLNVSSKSLFSNSSHKDGPPGLKSSHVDMIDIDSCISLDSGTGSSPAAGTEKKVSHIAPTLQDLLARDTFVDELLEGFSADSLAGLQVRYALSYYFRCR